MGADAGRALAATGEPRVGRCWPTSGSLRLGSAPYDASRLVPPVLSGAGTESLSYHRRAARELADLAPRGELVDIAGASHGVHLSHPADFADFVRRAVERSTDGDDAGQPPD